MEREELDCPFVFVDPETLIKSKFLQKHKYGMLELSENFDTYLLHLDQASKAYDKIKRADESDLDDLRYSCAKHFYKVHFQLIQLYDGYIKFIQSFSTSSKASHVSS